MICLDNPLISNGDHGGSLKNLDSSKISINGDLNQSKKLDEDDEEEEDQDSFMFGMSKWRTFFFFLSLALLLVFVLVFVFVLPCSESAQMNERTNHITHQGQYIVRGHVKISRVGQTHPPPPPERQKSARN